MFTSLLLTTSLFLACSESEIDNKPSADVQDVGSAQKTKKEAKASPKAVASITLPMKDGMKVEFVGSKVLKQEHSGGFEKVTGEVGIDDKGAVVSINANIDMNSIFSDNPKLTKHLMAPDFFDVSKYPKSIFTSTSVSKDKVTGILEMHGQKKEVSFPATITGSATAAAIKAQFTIDRKNWGVNYPGNAENLIRDEVLIKLDIQYGATAKK